MKAEYSALLCFAAAVPKRESNDDAGERSVNGRALGGAVVVSSSSVLSFRKKSIQQLTIPVLISDAVSTPTSL
jgi:hypothetical protein